MTQSVSSAILKIRELILATIVVISFLIPVVTTFSVGAWSMWGQDVITWTKDEIGLTRIEAQINSLAGEDKVIRVSVPNSYVEEPVMIGERVALILSMSRTVHGKDCVFTGGTSLFTGNDGVTLSGSPVNPVRQVSTSDTRLRVLMEHPIELKPGRHTVHLSLQYNCDGNLEFEETPPIAFILQERPEDEAKL